VLCAWLDVYEGRDQSFASESCTCARREGVALLWSVNGDLQAQVSVN
jgi:hypothetical protein